MTFGACEICGGGAWFEARRGPVRDGVFGALRQDACVGQCRTCGVQRLEESACTPGESYETDAYRQKLGNGVDPGAYFRNHDRQQIHTLRVVQPEHLRNATVADVGCGAGSLLDHLRGLTRQQVAVEPYDMFRKFLTSRGYAAYAYAGDAARDWKSAVDVAFSIQVIEHTANPREFLEGIKPLLKQAGRLIVSTPNRRDALLDLLPEYAQFFYRVVHRWYFDIESLSACARLAGFDVVDTRFVHRYGMSNMLHWLRDRKPAGDERFDVITDAADAWWVSHLEGNGRSDTIYVTLQPAGAPQ